MSDIKLKIDKRVDFIHAIVCSYVIKNNYKNKDEFDWVEFPNTKYFKDVVSKIDFAKFPKLEGFMLDDIKCDAYNCLAYLFDENFNIKYDFVDKVSSPFKTKSLREFLELVRNVYMSFDMNRVLEDNKEELELQQAALGELPKGYNKSYVFDFFGSDEDINLEVTGSIFMNGGFSSTIGDCLCCTRGINYENGKFFINKRYNFISINHEFAHHFVNPIVDKYYDAVTNYDYLFNEAKANGLPNAYMGMSKTILYEYFVRAISAIMSERWITRDEMKPDFEWFKSIGFVRVEEIADIIKENLSNYDSFGELYKNKLVPYLESFCLKNIISTSRLK